MGVAAEIALATAADYPLLQTVRDAVFSEWGHVSRRSIAQGLGERQDVLALLARAQNTVVGFAIGFRRGPEAFYLNYLALLAPFRGGGVGREMMRRQEDFARARKYRQMEFNTFNHFPRMLRLGLSLGYTPIGVEQHDGTSGDLAIRFGKSLLAESPPPAPPAPQAAETSMQVWCDDATAIRRRLDEGCLILGMIRNLENGRLFLQMSPPR